MEMITFYVNGKQVRTRDDPMTPFLSFLRRKLLLTGTKLVCGEGACGACTILISRIDHCDDQNLKHFTANACLLPLAWVHGCAVTTIEGIGSIKRGLHPLQKSLADNHGSQCGMCSPGIVMSIQGLLSSNNPPKCSPEDIEDTLSGNLCRCTGYRPIFEAFTDLSKGDNASQEKVKICMEALKISRNQLQEISGGTHFKGNNTEWYQPSTLAEMIELKENIPGAVVALGFSSLFWAQKAGFPPSVVISGNNVPDLFGWKQCEDGLQIGAGSTVTTLIQVIETLLPSVSQKQNLGNGLFELKNLLKEDFATSQLRNIATIGGSIFNKSGDIFTALVALGATLNIVSKGNERKVVMNAGFLNDVNSFISPQELLASVFIPFGSKNDIVKMKKHSVRKGTKGEMTLVVSGSSSENIRVIVGGLAKSVIVLPRSSKLFAKGDIPSLRDITESTTADLEQVKDITKVKREHKINLLARILHKLLEQVICNTEEIKEDTQYVPFKSQQKFTVVSDTQSEKDFVGRSLVHQSAYQQCSGEAIYVDDLPERKDELFLTFVRSTAAHAKIVEIDAKEALEMEGVEDFVWHGNVPDGMKPYFPQEKTEFYGQVIGFILAESREIARQAAAKVKVDYSQIEPKILDIKDAIEKGSFYHERRLQKGDAAAGLESSDKIAVGSTSSGPQEHWYLETQSCLVTPGEDGALDVIGSFQGASIPQHKISSALGIPANRVVFRVKRCGGGFGGKDSGRAVLLCVPTAYAAYKHGRPVRCVLERTDDVAITGHRPPYLAFYKLGASTDGTMNALDLEFFNEEGWKLDNSSGLMDKGLPNVDCCYRIPNINAFGKVCRTNKVSTPPTRGYGALEMHLMVESCIDDAARKLGFDPVEFRRKNLMVSGDINVTDDVMEGCTVTRCWDEVLEQSNFSNRKEQVKSFNRQNKYLKRGIYVIPVKMAANFGAFSAGAESCNRASALINPYQDGTILISHNGIEMGQGLHTKIIQIASRALDLPPHVFHIAETRTDMLANATVSGASACSDVNGRAVLDACIKLKATLEPYKTANPSGSWSDWVTAAVSDKVSLSTIGVFRKDDTGIFDWEKRTGTVFPYFTYGAGVSEIELNCRTGKYQIIRTDIVMDAGKSLNPSIDIGQIEGAFTMALGWLTTESFEYNEDGSISSNSLSSYILPGIENIPRELNVSLLKDSDNPWTQAIYSSKGVGEPPMTLAMSVFFAIKDAVSAYRESSGLPPEFAFTAPATAEKVLMACSS